MDQKTTNTYLKNAIMTATPAELTLMLYDGAIKFCNMALIGLEEGNLEKVNENLKRSQAIIMELRVSLNHKYPVWEDFERVYEFIYNRLIEANIRKDADILENAMKYIREMRDTWKEVMRLNNMTVD